VTKSIIFPPVDTETELKLRRLLETIEDYMDCEVIIDFTVIHNAMLMKVSFAEDRCDIEDIIQAIADCTEKNIGIKER
jgi:hypothetical protein